MVDSPESKICNRCGRKLALSLYGNLARSKDGHTNTCLECCRILDKLRRPREREKRNKACRDWYENNKEYADAYKKKWERERSLRKKWQRAFEKMLQSEIPAGYKCCARCKEYLLFERFPERLIRGVRKLHSYCRECGNAKARELYKTDPESKRRRAEAERLRYRRRCQEDPEGMRLKFLTVAHRRRERHTQNGERSTVQLEVYWQVFKRDNYKCLCCGSAEQLELDHIVPISKGGRSVLDNLQVLCRGCNASKHTKIIDYRENICGA